MNRYKSINKLTTDTGRRYTSNPIYPTVPLSADDFYVITTIGDRYDTLAHKFYSDSSLWWIIASANNSEKGSLIVEPGVQIRIPADKEIAISLFNDINTNR